MKLRFQSSDSICGHLSAVLRRRRSRRFISSAGCRGFSLLELIITLTVLAILVMGTIPLMQNSVKRQKELRLRETLRQVREAIDEFHRDTIGACPLGAIRSGNPAAGVGPSAPAAPSDPRSRVIVDDCTIFTTDNIDRYPPDLETLVGGVTVKARGLPSNFQGGRGLGDDKTEATEINSSKEITKIYLREMPVDPMTGKSDWKLRSSYQTEDSGSWDDVNVFDVRSNSDEESLSGDKYSDW